MGSKTGEQGRVALRRAQSGLTFSGAGRFVRDLAANWAAHAVAGIEWRRRRLLILGYHGISLSDEHRWDGTVYMRPDMFRRRLSILREAKCAVLPLQAALQRLYEGTLPARAVAIVFDDGFHDFARAAAPLLADFNYRATVFLSTYYAQYNRPIFDLMLRYLLWKGAHRSLLLPGFVDKPLRLNESGQRSAAASIMQGAFEHAMSGPDKDRLLIQLADALHIDYEPLCQGRLLHIMNASEVREMKRQGHEIQLHTHRHKVSRNREVFEREIRENRDWIQRETGGPLPQQFSFPGGVWQPVAREWLSEIGIHTAMTCRPALADAGCDRLHLPRFIDHAHVREWAFRGWLAGSMAFLPKGKEVVTDRQIFEETVQEDAQVCAHAGN